MTFVVLAILLSRGGANELLTLNGASGFESGLADLDIELVVREGTDFGGVEE